MIGTKYTGPKAELLAISLKGRSTAEQWHELKRGGCGGWGEVLSVSFIINLLAGIWLPASWTRSADGHILSLVLCTSQTSFIGPLSGTITLPLCDMLKLCLPSSHSSRLAFSLSLTLSTSNWPQVNMCVFVCTPSCVCVQVCVSGWGLIFVDRFVYVNIWVFLCFLFIYFYNLSMKYMWKGALRPHCHYYQYNLFSLHFRYLLHTRDALQNVWRSKGGLWLPLHCWRFIHHDSSLRCIAKTGSKKSSKESLAVGVVIA